MNVLLSITGRDPFECPLDSFCVDEIVMQHSTSNQKLKESLVHSYVSDAL